MVKTQEANLTKSVFFCDKFNIDSFFSREEKDVLINVICVDGFWLQYGGAIQFWCLPSEFGYRSQLNFGSIHEGAR